jgi:hypothetical protein
MRVAHQIQPGFVIETGGVDHQRVALPSGYRVPSQAGCSISLGKPAAIGVNPSMGAVGFIQDYDHLRRLNNLVQLRHQTGGGDADGQTTIGTIWFPAGAG